MKQGHKEGQVEGNKDETSKIGMKQGHKERKKQGKKEGGNK